MVSSLCVNVSLFYRAGLLWADVLEGPALGSSAQNCSEASQEAHSLFYYRSGSKPVGHGPLWGLTDPFTGVF